jgi:hypothetical protein
VFWSYENHNPWEFELLECSLKIQLTFWSHVWSYNHNSFHSNLTLSRIQNAVIFKLEPAHLVLSWHREFQESNFKV